MHGEQGGETTASSAVVEERRANIGATIMGRNMFGGGTGSWGEDPWPGWWGEDPPLGNAPGEPLAGPRGARSEISLRRPGDPRHRGLLRCAHRLDGAAHPAGRVCAC